MLGLILKASNSKCHIVFREKFQNSNFRLHNFWAISFLLKKGYPRKVRLRHKKNIFKKSKWNVFEKCAQKITVKIKRFAVSKMAKKSSNNYLILKWIILCLLLGGIIKCFIIWICRNSAKQGVKASCLEMDVGIPYCFLIHLTARWHPWPLPIVHPSCPLLFRQQMYFKVSTLHKLPHNAAELYHYNNLLQNSKR